MIGTTTTKQIADGGMENFSVEVRNANIKGMIR